MFTNGNFLSPFGPIGKTVGATGCNHGSVDVRITSRSNGDVSYVVSRWCACVVHAST